MNLKEIEQICYKEQLNLSLVSLFKNYIINSKG